MFFRNLTLFRFSPDLLRTSLESLFSRLHDHELKPLGPLELSTRGFVSPFGRGHEALSLRSGDCLLLTLGGEDKILPVSVVNEALSAKIAAIREQEARSPGPRERQRLKDEVLTDLLPRAFAKPSRVPAYLDLAGGWLVVDSSSRKNAEAVVVAIREALGSFPVYPATAEGSPRVVLTGWIAGEDLPSGFALGDEFELIEPGDGGAIGKFRRQEADTEEIEAHLQAGKQCSRLALNFHDRLSFVLGDDLVIRKLRFLDAATDDLDNDEIQRREDELSAIFTLMTGELRLLLGLLDTEFCLNTP